MLTQGKAEYTTLPHHWLEVHPYDTIIENYKSKPRILSSHLTLSQLPQGFRYDFFILIIDSLPLYLYFEKLKPILQSSRYKSCDTMNSRYKQKPLSNQADLKFGVACED